MAITAAEIKLFKSANGGLGGAIDNGAEMTSGVTGNLFNTFSGAETAAGGTFYHCFYVKNTNGTLTAEAVQAYIDSETDHAGVNVSIGIGTSAVNGVEQTIANENTAPAGVTFVDTDTTTSGAGVADGTINVPNIPSGQHQAMWVRVTIDAATSAVTGYATNIKIDFDTAA